jgi:hypothetical protein
MILGMNRTDIAIVTVAAVAIALDSGQASTVDPNGAPGDVPATEVRLLPDRGSWQAPPSNRDDPPPLGSGS